MARKFQKRSYSPFVTSTADTTFSSVVNGSDTLTSFPTVPMKRVRWNSKKKPGPLRQEIED